MLFAVEGGGFFSSSASGYSKGLTLLLLGHQKQEESKPMKVAPWNHYQLVDQGEPEPDLQLASLKNRVSRGCAASLVCFGRASAGVDSSSPSSHPKVGPAQHQDALPVDDLKEDITIAEIEDDKNASKAASLKSSLKKSSLNHVSVPVEDAGEHAVLNEQVSDSPGHNGRRKVQWTDACGSELAEIREFEPRYATLLSPDESAFISC
ncbi:unnamed protein product [Linum tenue]|uniref:Uncharacterized protein n=2 Tax=Linum tenue TaxID=586396 RepID=A0AAV0RHU7_9ROSI|nr:unnamed protein product [Linum tenue]